MKGGEGQSNTTAVMLNM